MAQTTFTLNLVLDGSDVKAQAAQLKTAIQGELSQGFEIKVDAKGAKAATALIEAVAKNAPQLAQAAGAVAALGKIDAAGLAAADKAMTAILKTAGKVGAELAAGAQGGFDKLQTTLAAVQVQLSGVIKSSGQGVGAGLLDDMPELTDALNAQDKKAFELAEKLRAARIEADAAKAKIAELGQIKVAPTGGGAASTLAELFRGFDSEYVSGKIRKAVKAIDAELAPLQAQIAARMGGAAEGLAAERARLEAEIARVGAEFDRLNAMRPGAGVPLFAEGDVVVGDILPPGEWDAAYAQIAAEYDALNKQLDAVRSEAIRGDAAELRDELFYRQRELEKPLAGEFKFWEEWATGNIDAVVQMLKASGQTAQAEALSQMAALTDTYKRAQATGKRAFGGLQEGGTAVLPADAKGTLVDFVTAERTLGAVAEASNTPIKTQARLVGNLTLKFKAAADEAVRLAAVEVGVTPAADTPVADIAAQVDAAVAETTAELGSAEPVAAAEKTAGGILAAFVRLYHRLVGHSVIPDMVREINAWLARIDPAFFGVTALGDIAEKTAAEIVDEFAGIAEFVPVDQIGARLTELQTEIAAFNQEMGATMLRGGSEMDRRAQDLFAASVDEARRLRGESAADEAMYAQGKLPRGFGRTGGESAFYKGAVTSGGEQIEETTDQWYQAMAVGLEAKQRFTQAETQRMEEVMAGLATAEAQYAGLVMSLYQQVESLAAAVTQAENPEAELEQLGQVDDLLKQIAAGYADVAEAKDAAIVKTEAVAGIAGVQAVQAETQAVAEERAYARTPAGVAAIEDERRQTAIAVGAARERAAAARAEGAAKIATARASAAVVVETEKQATAAIKAEGLVQVETAKQATAAAKAKATAAGAQGVEKARRVTIKAKTAGAVAVVDAKAASVQQAQYNKLLEEAQKLAAEIGIPWAQVEATMAETGASLATVVGEFKGFKAESQAAAKAQAQVVAQTEALRKTAIEVGVPWADVEDAMQRTGMSAKAMQGVLARVRRETMLARAETSVWGRVFSDAQQQAVGMAKAISDARNQYQGITQLAGDMQQAGRSAQQVGTAITGSLTLATKEYIEFTATSDVAARALGLNAQQAEEFSRVVIDLAGDLAYVSADELAQGVITWAKAVGQTAETEADFRRIIEQTIPAQQAAALSQENLNTLLEGGAAAVRQFGLPVSDLGRVLALEGKVADGTNASFESLNEALKYLGPTAKALDVPLEDALATLGLLEEAGISGSQAGRGVGMALQDVVNPTKKATETLQEYFGAAQPFFEGGKFVGIPKMIEKWAAALKDKTDEERQAALGAVYDANAVRTLTPLIEGQIDAWDDGINVARAYSKNLLGVRDAEVEAWAARKLAEEGVAVEMGGAEDVRTRQLEQYMSSQKRQVDELKAAWREFWLVVGGQVTGTVIGGLKNVADIVQEITKITDAHPELVKIAGAAGVGLLAGGTLLNAVGALARSGIAVKSVLDGLQAWSLGRGTAEARFQTTVISAAESFRAIIAQAATTAAGTEQAGAVAETATENAGAVAETGIEVQGAVAEAAIEQAGAAARGGGSLLGRVGGAILGGGAVAAGGVAAVGGAAAYGVMKAGEAITGRKFGDTVAEFNALVSGAMGSLIGKGPEFAKFTYGLYESLGIVEKQAQGATAALGGTAMMLPVVLKTGQAAQAASPPLVDLANNLEELPPAVAKVGPTLEQQLKAAELYAAMLKERAALEQQLADTLAGLSRDLNNDLAKLAQDYTKNRAAEEADFQKSQVEAQRDYNAERERAAAEHNKAMRRMDEDHAMRVADLQIDRDALGLYEEQQSYAVEKARAEEDFADQAAQGAAEFAAEQAQAAAQHAEKMNDLAVQYAAERETRLTEYQTAVTEAQTQHAEEIARLEADYFERLNAELGYYTLSQAQQTAYNQAMLADADKFLAENRAKWAAYVASLPIPGKYTGASDKARGSRAAGGYVGGGLYNLHPGEFVLSPETTRQVEAAQGGGRLTQGAVTAGRPVQITASFQGVGASDRAWIEARLAQFAGQVAQAVAG